MVQTHMKQVMVTICLSLVFADGVASAAECVVLLHGLARTSSSLNAMQKALEEDGYLTANIDYPSREHEIVALADMAVGEGLAICRAGEDVENTGA